MQKEQTQVGRRFALKLERSPGAQNTDYFLKDIGISRAAFVSNLRGLSFIMGRMDAEKVGWQTVLGARL